MGSLSLCMTASRDEGTVREILTLLRPVVDEVVLGVDSRASDRILGACGDLVDRAYTYRFETTVEQYSAWLYHRCGADWIFRIDDDEVPSTALLEQLPEIAEDRRHSLVLLPMRHLFPTRERFIASHPWHPDYHARVVRNVPGLWTFEGGCHAGVQILGEHRRIPEAPLYHLHFADPDTEARLAMARRRDRAVPGRMTEGFNVNAVSLPELWTELETKAVPEQDRHAIERVVVAAPTTPRRASSPAATATTATATAIPPDDAERLLASRRVSPGAYSAEISISTARTHLAAGTIAHLEVHVRNRGTEHWPPAHQSEPPIRLAYRWLATDGETVIEPEGLRTPFEETVFPGERTVAMLAVRVPDAPGSLVLEVDVVHELVRWFDCATRMEIAVEQLDAPPSNGSSGLARPDLTRIGFQPS
ncbi:MAG: hypothetical protein M3N56_07545 [Actinomycetota bacterium]|nr:hypothetical protein [Actinomycetota bacterium]